MAKVIVAFSKPEDAKKIRNILMKYGFEVAEVCTCGAQAIYGAGKLGSGIVVCGGRFADMVYEELYNCLPPGFSMLLLTSSGSLRPPKDVVCLGLPLRVNELVDALLRLEEWRGLQQRRQKPELHKRSGAEQEIIGFAKRLLMDRKHMTEAAAHRYLQKCSMDSGRGLAETARMVVCLMS